MSIKKVFYLLTATVLLTALLSGTRAGVWVTSVIRDGLIAVMSWGYHSRTAVLASDPNARACVVSYIDQAAFATVQQENEVLKKMLSYKEKSARSVVGARVLARSNDPTRFVITIDKGSADGVQKGKAVISDEGVLIGIVQDVYETNATVRLIADPQSKIAGRLVNKTNTEGVVSGGHGIIVRMELIPRTEKIELDTLLLTSGLDTVVPEGLMIGKVIATEEDSNTLFQRAIIEPVLDLTRIINVAVLL